MVTAGSVYISDGASANRWRPLPMLLSGASGRVLGIGPNGLLVMELRDVAAPLAPDATALSPIVTLCAWDPSASRWLSPCLIEPANSSVVSVAWDEQSGAAAPQLVIWFMTRTDHLWQNITPAADWLPHGSLCPCSRHW